MACRVPFCVLQLSVLALLIVDSTSQYSPSSSPQIYVRDIETVKKLLTEKLRQKCCEPSDVGDDVALICKDVFPTCYENILKKKSPTRQEREQGFNDDVLSTRKPKRDIPSEQWTGLEGRLSENRPSSRRLLSSRRSTRRRRPRRKGTRNQRRKHRTRRRRPKNMVSASGNAKAFSMSGKKILIVTGKPRRHTTTRRTTESKDGHSAAAVGNAVAVVSDGKHIWAVSGKGKPAAISSGNGAAMASNGHHTVTSSHGKTPGKKPKTLRKSAASHYEKLLEYFQESDKKDESAADGVSMNGQGAYAEVNRPAVKSSADIFKANLELQKSIQQKNEQMIRDIMAQSMLKPNTAQYDEQDNSEEKDSSEARFNPFEKVGLQDPSLLLPGRY